MTADPYVTHKPNPDGRGRVPRRFQVRYRSQGSPKDSVGYTTNVSSGGMFVGTNWPHPPGTALTVRVEHGASSFFVDGVVVYTKKVHSALQALRPSGMGVRLVGRSPELESLAGTPPPTNVKQPSAPTAEPAPEPGVFPVRFDTREKLADVFRQEIQFGQLSILTERPQEEGTPVRIDLLLPGHQEAVHLAARVLRHQSTASKRATRMTVTLDDASGAFAACRPFLT